MKISVLRRGTLRLLALVTIGAIGLVPCAPIGAMPPTAPVVSALVVVAGPSVHDRFAALAGPQGTAAESVARAASLRRELDAAEADVDRRQAPVVDAARRLGVTVISRYRTVASALLVHATPAQLADLARTPNVAGIEPAPLLRPALTRSVPRIKADVLAAQLGYDGAGTVVAVVDSGIDYTHAHFGGPGTPAAYQTAAAAAERIDDQWDGKPLFPTDKVIGGWDFVGPKYTHPNYCTDDLVRQGRCVNVPQPDADPLDEHNHGTHVAGIVAGNATNGLGDGVAPGAKLVALKIYGTPSGLYVDESIDVVVDAIEWCANVNLGRAVRGVAPEHVDVINMSLGEPFSQGGRLFDRAIEAAADVGVVVVASAGNSYDRPYVIGAPSSSPKVLSVASSIIAGDLDVISDFSARGPGKHGTLKPDLTAPGSGITSASRSTGTGGVGQSGTSMASPHVAGAAALLHQRNRAENLGLEATDVAALLMNYAQPDVLTRADASAAPVGVTRQGAGRIDLLRAGTGKLLARAGDIASVNLGMLALAAPAPDQSAVVTLRNLSATDLFVLPRSRFIRPDDANRGVTVVLPDEPVAVPARATVQIPVVFRFDLQAMRAWDVRGLPWADAATMDRLEIDGYIAFDLVDAGGDPMASEPAPSVPFYALPRRKSAVRGTATVRAGEARLRFASDADAGPAELFTLPAGAAAEDPDEPDVLGELDVKGVGVRFESPAGAAPSVTFGLALHAVAPIPQATSLEIYADLDRDGRIDQRVRTGAMSLVSGRGNDDRMSLLIGRWDDAAGTVLGTETSLGELPSDLYTRVAQVRVPLAALGLSAPAPFDFYVVHRGITEDWWNAATTDIVPDGADRAGGTRFRAEPAAWTPAAWAMDVPAGGSAEIVLQGLPADPADPSMPMLLALYPANGFDQAGEQAQVFDLRTGTGRKLWLPFAGQRR